MAISPPVPENKWSQLCDMFRLSPRERQLLRLIMADAPDAFMAENLGLSVHTIHTYMDRLYRKLGVNSRCQVVLCLFAN